MNKTKKFKKIIALILSIMMIILTISVISVSSYAVTLGEEAGPNIGPNIGPEIGPNIGPETDFEPNTDPVIEVVTDPETEINPGTDTETETTPEANTEPEQVYYTVTFVDDESGLEIAEPQTILSGQNAQRPVLPVLRDSMYDSNFTDDDLKNITTDTELSYKKVPKTYKVTSSSEDVTLMDYSNNNVVDGDIEYNSMVQAKYTGNPSDIKGWIINDKIVSLTPSIEYNFFVNQTTIIKPVLETTQIDSDVYISVGEVNSSTERVDGTGKLYYPIVATGYESDKDAKYGVIRSTTKSDVNQNEVESYIREGSSTNVVEYTLTDVMNDDGRYNYVAIAPTDTDKTLYMQAWIEVNGQVYMSNLTEVIPAKKF